MTCGSRMRRISSFLFGVTDDEPMTPPPAAGPGVPRRPRCSDGRSALQHDLEDMVTLVRQQGERLLRPVEREAVGDQVVLNVTRAILQEGDRLVGEAPV